MPASERKEEAGTGSFLPSPITNASLPRIESVWDVVGSDDLLEIPVDDIVRKDKQSMMLYNLFLRDKIDEIETLLEKVNQNNKTSVAQAVPPEEIIHIKLSSNQPSTSTIQAVSSEERIPLENSTQPSSTPAPKDSPNDPPSIKLSKDIACKAGKRMREKYKDYFRNSNCIFQNFAGGVIFNKDYLRIEDQLAELGLKATTYSEYNIDKAYRIIPLNPLPFGKHDFLHPSDTISTYLLHLENLIKGGFPYRSPKNGKYLRFPIFEPLINNFRIKMSFLFKGERSQESMILAKRLFFYKDCTGIPVLFKQYLPVIFLRDKKDSESEVYGAFASLPKKNTCYGRYIPLYNTFGLQKVKKAKTVVICGAIEDADAMQRYDSSKQNAYIAFVCDPEEFYQVNFSPLKGKKVEFLISNHSGRTIEEERTRIKNCYLYLKSKKRSGIKEFSFVERTVHYPQAGRDSIEEYCCVYSEQKAIVTNKTRYSEIEFQALICNRIGYSVQQERKEDIIENIDSNREESKKRRPGRPQHRNLTAEKTILRPFIRRGCTTVLTGDPGIGKSRFAIALAAQVAGSNKEFLKDRFWTRCLPPRGEKNGFKVVYWVFDDVDKDDISLQRKFFARGLSKDQEKNLFIEPGRSIRRRDCESLKEELKRYSSRGMQNHPVDFLIIDTLLSFAGSPAKIFSAFEELVRLKDEMPSLAILVIHHNSKEGNPFGGILATNMPRVIIEMKRDNTDVTDDLEDPITVNIIKHSNEHFGIDIVPFEIKLDNDHFVITNNSDLPQETIKKLVIYEYKSNRLEQFSSTDIGRLLGVPRHRIENTWNKEVEEEAKALWSKIKLKQKEKAKALNKASSRKKESSKDDGQPKDDVQHQPQKEKRPSRKASSPHANTSARQGNRNKR